MERELQERTCQTYGAEFFASPDDLKIGISESAMKGDFPVHGLRHPPDGDTAGWYIWAGDYSEDEDFFHPIHVKHLAELCPYAVKFLGLPPGWRFLVGDKYEDVWYDIELLKT